MTKSPSRDGQSHWTFLSNHSHVLICIARDPHIRLREVAEKVGVTERAVQKIVAELEAGGYLERERDGRRNRYRLYVDRYLRHPVEGTKAVRDLLKLVLSDQEIEKLVNPSEAQAVQDEHDAA